VLLMGLCVYVQCCYQLRHHRGRQDVEGDRAVLQHRDQRDGEFRTLWSLWLVCWYLLRFHLAMLSPSTSPTSSKSVDCLPPKNPLYPPFPFTTFPHFAPHTLFSDPPLETSFKTRSVSFYPLPTLLLPPRLVVWDVRL
jgi:hypothetical protein